MQSEKIVEIQKLIREERIKQGYSYSDLAKRIGCSARAVSYWETGKRDITVEMADRALAVLGGSITLGKSIRR